MFHECISRSALVKNGRVGLFCVPEFARGHLRHRHSGEGRNLRFWNGSSCAGASHRSAYPATVALRLITREPKTRPSVSNSLALDLSMSPSATTFRAYSLTACPGATTVSFSNILLKTYFSRHSKSDLYAEIEIAGLIWKASKSGS